MALAIEGGAMRGTISAGMALALDELGLVDAFDAVYGASAGAITGAWLLSRQEGLRGWTEPAYARAFIRRSGLLRGRPVADVRALIEELYQTTFPPAEFGGRRFYDAGLSESVPYRTALAQGATHVLVLRSRRDPAGSPEVSRLATDGRLLRAAFEAGRAATHAALKMDQYA
jgi:predicted patatin/cPLA2 family phospholipase